MDLAHPLTPASKWLPAYQEPATASSLPSFNELFGDVNERYPLNQVRAEGRSPPRQRARHSKDLGPSFSHTGQPQPADIKRTSRDRQLPRSVVRKQIDPAAISAMDSDSLRLLSQFGEHAGNPTFKDERHRSPQDSSMMNVVYQSPLPIYEADKVFGNPAPNASYHALTQVSNGPATLACSDTIQSHHQHSKSSIESNIPVRFHGNPFQQSRRRGLDLNNDQNVGLPTTQYYQQTPHTSPQPKSEVSSSGRECKSRL